MDADRKTALLELLVGSTASGWNFALACRQLELAEVRAYRWKGRRATGELDDRISGGNPMHGLLDEEVQAIVDLYHEWGEIYR